MSYTVHSIFPTIQGEGFHAGTPAVFVRFAGCNLWSGREEDRGASCSAWCDTNFIGGERYDLAPLVAAIVREAGAIRFAVLTGGEPALQIDSPLIEELHALGFRVAIETNGTLRLPGNLNWVTLSPKAGAPVVLTRADELKLVFPQAGADPESFADFHATHRFLQPMDGLDRETNTRAAVEYCLAHPAWRLSVQTHKFIGID